MKRAPFMYTCLRNLSPAQEKKIKQLKKDTNAQEGLGGFIQSLNNDKTMGLFNMLRLIFGFITLCDTESIIHRGESIQNTRESLQGRNIPLAQNRQRSRITQMRFIFTLIEQSTVL